MPSSAIGSVLQSMPGSVLEYVLRGVLGNVLGVYLGHYAHLIIIENTGTKQIHNCPNHERFKSISPHY